MDLVEELARAYWDCNRHNYVPPWNSESIHPKQKEAVRIGIRGAIERLDQLGYVVVRKSEVEGAYQRGRQDEADYNPRHD